MSSNLNFFSTKSGNRTRGLTTAADSEVCFKFVLTFLSPLNPNSEQDLISHYHITKYMSHKDNENCHQW